MDELARLRARRRRRQEAFQALDTITDSLQALQATLERIERLALELQKRRGLFIAPRVPESAYLLGLLDRANPALVQIFGRAQEIRAEFLSLAHSDDRERLALEALLNPPTQNR